MTEVGLHKSHPGFALCVLGMILFWGLLGLGYLLSPEANIVKTGTLEYVNKVPRHVWSVTMLSLTALMIIGAGQVPQRTKLLRFTLAFGCLLCLARGVLTAIPYVRDLFSGLEGAGPSSFGGVPVYLFADRDWEKTES